MNDGVAVRVQYLIVGLFLMGNLVIVLQEQPFEMISLFFFSLSQFHSFESTYLNRITIHSEILFSSRISIVSESRSQFVLVS